MDPERSRSMLHAEFQVRPATIADVDVIARHRAEMFREIHSLDDPVCASIEEASRVAIASLLATGEYLGALASPADDPGTIVAGAGIRLRPALPSVRMVGGRSSVHTGPQGLVVNVYTERQWRRRGLGALIVSRVLAQVQAHDVADIVLHASVAGRALYESLGFVPTNEMRYAGPPARESA